MRVSSINVNDTTRYQKRVAKFANSNNVLRTKDSVGENANNVNFKGSTGKIAGGLFGAAGAGLLALSVMTGVGVAAAAAFVVAEIGGAVIGGKIGDLLTGKDKEN